MGSYVSVVVAVIKIRHHFRKRIKKQQLIFAHLKPTLYVCYFLMQALDLFIAPIANIINEPAASIYNFV